ncbi:hypothetical protein KAF44_23815 (plasmid) [Cupriavidus necator]|nr:hypothetical protein KAF44_23815 [Cupriavidus necator]
MADLLDQIPADTLIGSRSLARNPSVSPEFSITEEPLFSISIYATTPS